MGSTIFNLNTIIGSLYGLGARHFLLPNLPDLGLTPEAISFGAGYVGAATSLSQQFNDSLATSYSNLQVLLPGATIITFDFMAAQRALIAGASGNGFSNVTGRCLSTSGAVCAAPDTYVYWDNIHPTAAAHQLLGSQMATMAAVPEPATMLLMAAGVLAVLGAGRRKASSAGQPA